MDWILGKRSPSSSLPCERPGVAMALAAGLFKTWGALGWVDAVVRGPGAMFVQQFVGGAKMGFNLVVTEAADAGRFMAFIGMAAGLGNMGLQQTTKPTPDRQTHTSQHKPHRTAKPIPDNQTHTTTPNCKTNTRPQDPPPHNESHIRSPIHKTHGPNTNSIGRNTDAPACC